MTTRLPATVSTIDSAHRFEALVGRAQPPPAADQAPVPVTQRSQSDPPGLGRSIVIASAATITIVLVGVTAGLLATGTSLASSIGIGVFAALWGGGGFGAMIGGVVHVHRFGERTHHPSVVGSELDRSPALLPVWPSHTPIASRRGELGERR